MENNLATVHLPSLPAWNSYPTQPRMGNHQLVVISQLLQIIEQVQHVNDVFSWLVHTLLQRFGLDVIQLWTLQGQTEGQATLELRAMVSRNVALPQYVVNNSHVVREIKHVLRERSGLMPMPVSIVFSQEQVNLLAQHNLHYWGYSFLCNDSLLLPVVGKHNDNKEVSAPLMMVVSLFMQQSPSLRLLPTIGHILEQTVLIAKKRGLLLDRKQQQFPLFTSSPTQQDNFQPIESKSALLDLIPSRVRTSNPLVGTLLLADWPAYQLYHAIDGYKSLAELASSTRCKPAEFQGAVRILLNRNYIRFHEKAGRLVENELVLQSL